MELRAIFAANIKRLRKERGIRNVGLDNIGVIAAALKVAPEALLRA